MERAGAEAGGFGLFIRALVGLDREAAKEAFAGFLGDNTDYSGDQIDFVCLIIDHLTERGAVDARRFYESPFTDICPLGPEEIFGPSDVERMVAVLEQVRRNAAAA